MNFANLQTAAELGKMFPLPQLSADLDHYSLLASLQQTFGLGCLLHSCTANPMTKLFKITGSTTVAELPPPFDFPTSTDPVSPQGPGEKAAPVSLTGSGWRIVQSSNFGLQDNVLASVSAISATDALGRGHLHSTGLGSAGHIGTSLRRYPLDRLPPCRT